MCEITVSKLFTGQGVALMSLQLIKNNLACKKFGRLSETEIKQCFRCHLNPIYDLKIVQWQILPNLRNCIVSKYFAFGARKSFQSSCDSWQESGKWQENKPQLSAKRLLEWPHEVVSESGSISIDSCVKMTN